MDGNSTRAYTLAHTRLFQEIWRDAVRRNNHLTTMAHQCKNPWKTLVFPRILRINQMPV